MNYSGKMYSSMSCVLASILLLLAEIVSGDSLVGAPIKNKCTGQLAIVDVQTKTLIHKIVDTNIDILIDIGKNKNVEVSQTGNCCHHVFSSWRCRGEWLSIEDNDKHEMKHKGRMTVIKSDMEDGRCKSVRDLKSTGVCEMEQKPVRGELKLPKQVQFDHTTDISVQDFNEVTVVALNDDTDLSVKDSNQHTDVSGMDSNKAISSNEVADISVVNSNNKLPLAKVEVVNDTSIEAVNNDSSTAISLSEVPHDTSYSIAAVCVLLAVVTISLAILLVRYKNSNGRSCLNHSILGTNTWSPVSKDDFAIDMDDSQFDDNRSIIKNKNKNIAYA